MKPTRSTPLFAALLLAIGGCTETRSISDSGYSANSRRSYGRTSNELTEADVLGTSQKKTITNADIRQALASSSKVNLLRGKPVVVVQAGAATPETAMLRNLESFYSVVPFSGLKDSVAAGDYSLQLRLAAAQGGCPRILVYWGTLETERVDRATKAVSWVPIAGSLVPDETQQMRLRMKAAIIDVAGGNWSMASSAELGDKRLSAGIVRENSDQAQVQRLKTEGYRAFVEKLVREHTR